MFVAYFCFKQSDTNNIYDLLEKYCLFKDFKFVIEKFNSKGQFFKIFEHKKYKIIFFDMSGNYDGCIEIGKKIREIDNDIPIVFFAGNKYYAYDAFEIYAADYIFKPVKFERLERTLDRIMKNIPVMKKFISVNVNKINTKINIANIIYIEVIGNVSCIHMTPNNIVKVYMTLSELEDTLKNNPLFLRTHKSYIVNMDFVSDMQGNSFIMKNGDVVAIRKNNCREIKQIYKRFFLNRNYRETPNKG